MRDPDLICVDESAGEDRVIVDALFGGCGKPFRMVICTDREGVMPVCEYILQPKAEEYGLWRGEKIWASSMMGCMLNECLHNIGETVEAASFGMGYACRLTINDKRTAAQAEF